MFSLLFCYVGSPRNEQIQSRLSTFFQMLEFVPNSILVWFLFCFDLLNMLRLSLHIYRVYKLKKKRSFADFEDIFDFFCLISFHGIHFSQQHVISLKHYTIPNHVRLPIYSPKHIKPVKKSTKCGNFQSRHRIFDAKIVFLL